MGHPVVWEYDDTTGRAECLFTLHGSPLMPDAKTLLKQLKKEPDVTISKDRAYIKNLQKFLYHPLLDLSFQASRPRSNSSPPSSPGSSESSNTNSSASSSPCPSPAAKTHYAATRFAIPLHGLAKLNGKGKQRPRLSAGLFSPPPLVRRNSSEAGVMKKSQLTPRGTPVNNTPIHHSPASSASSSSSDLIVRIKRDPRQSQSIAIDDLHLHDDHRRQTFTFEKKEVSDDKEQPLDVKMQEKQKSLQAPTTIRAVTQIFTEFIKKTADTIIPIKQDMAAELRHLFDNILNPAFRQKLTDDDVVTLEMRTFFGHAMCAVMSVGDTDILQKILDAMRPPASSGKQHKAINERITKQDVLTAVNANLWQLFFFVNDDISADRLTPNAETNAILQRLRTRTLDVRGEIKENLNALTELQYILLYKTAELQLEREKFQDKIKNHLRPGIYGYMSFHYLMNVILNALHPLKAKDTNGIQSRNDLIARIITRLITLLPDACRRLPETHPEVKFSEKFIQTQIGPIRGEETDFFISGDLFLYLENSIKSELAVKYEPSAYRSFGNNTFDAEFQQFITGELLKHVASYLITLSIRSQKIPSRPSSTLWSRPEGTDSIPCSSSTTALLESCGDSPSAPRR